MAPVIRIRTVTTPNKRQPVRAFEAREGADCVVLARGKSTVLGPGPFIVPVSCVKKVTEPI